MFQKQQIFKKQAIFPNTWEDKNMYRAIKKNNNYRAVHELHDQEIAHHMGRYCT